MMENKTKIKVNTDIDLLTARSAVKVYCREIGLSVVQTTKLLTAVNEVIRNMLNYAKGGVVSSGIITNEKKQKGVQVICKDQGKGIRDVELAMQKGYSTNQSMGMGLPSAKILVPDFSITSDSSGTCIEMISWKR